MADTDRALADRVFDSSLQVHTFVDLLASEIDDDTIQPMIEADLFATVPDITDYPIDEVLEEIGWISTQVPWRFAIEASHPDLVPGNGSVRSRGGIRILRWFTGESYDLALAKAVEWAEKALDDAFARAGERRS